MRLHFTVPTARSIIYSDAIMFEILALAASVLTADPMLVREARDNFPNLPDDLCIDLSIFKQAAEPECAEYYIVNPKTGSRSPLSMPMVIGHTLAELLDESVRRGLLSLEKKSPSQRFFLRP